MLSEKKYDPSYIANCRSQFQDLLRAYSEVPGSQAFETAFLSHVVLALDHYFIHRMRGSEGKDGNPLNEVRMLCNSIKHHDAVLAADSTIKYEPGRSVLGTEIGQEIQLSPEAAARLGNAFFDEIEDRY